MSNKSVMLLLNITQDTFLPMDSRLKMFSPLVIMLVIGKLGFQLNGLKKGA